MLYCINPRCSHRENPDHAINCQNCGTQLLVDNRYKLLRPLRELTGDYFSDLFLVEDIGSNPEEWGTHKVLKVLRDNNDSNLVRLFKQESMTLMWLKSPAVPTVEPDGYFTINTTYPAQSLHCLVMEYIEGDNLEELVKKKGAIDEATALEWLTQLAEILHNLHQRNLAHRDIKPSNIILRPNGQLVLIDFGTVGLGETGEWGNTKIGSINYAAPEQLNGSAVLASDFFALGRTFVYLLTGKTPLELENYQTGKELNLDFGTSVKASVDFVLNLLINKTPLDIQNNRPKNKLAWRYHVQGEISDHLGNLIDELMAYEVKDRPKNTVALQSRLRFSPQEIAQQRLRQRLVFGSLLISVVGIFATSTNPIGGVFAGNINAMSGNNIDRSLQNIGTDKFINEELGSAELFFKVALFFNPNNQASTYSLGRVCERTNQVNCAMENYRTVIQSNTNNMARAAATSSLTRLQIFYQQPVDYSLLHKALAAIQEYNLSVNPEKQDTKISASLHKNLGWLQFQSNQIVDAERSLQTSIKLNPDRPAPYCLLAQVLEEKKQESLALEQWRECSKRINDNSSSEELQWFGMAQKRLTAAYPNYKPSSIQPKDSK